MMLNNVIILNVVTKSNITRFLIELSNTQEEWISSCSIHFTLITHYLKCGDKKI